MKSSSLRGIYLMNCPCAGRHVPAGLDESAL